MCYGLSLFEYRPTWIFEASQEYGLAYRVTDNTTNALAAIDSALTYLLQTSLGAIQLQTSYHFDMLSKWLDVIARQNGYNMTGRYIFT